MPTPEQITRQPMAFPRGNPDELALYRDAKLAAATAANAHGEHVMECNARKSEVIREIYVRAFRAAGLLRD